METATSMEARHMSLDELNAGLSLILESPTDGGSVEMLVVRPEIDERVTPDSAELSAELGMHGDHWATDEYRDEPAIQVAIMNSRVVDLVAGSRERWSLAGDNIMADLDLSKENLAPGQKLQAGSAILEITEIPHAGCNKFSERFGPDALRFVNLGPAKDLRLRGVYARVVQPGTIKVGDQITKI
jgi:MOSC domain-containing protein YiiM